MSFQSVGFLAFLAGTVLICLTAERRHPQAGRLLLMLACALGLLHYAVGNGHAGAHGVRVGHQVYKGIAACRSCLAAGGDVLFILKAGRAPMAVGVHKAGQRRKAAAVQRFLAGPGFQLQALRKNFAVPHAKVKLFAVCAGKILQDHGIFPFCSARPRRGGLLGFG